MNKETSRLKQGMIGLTAAALITTGVLGTGASSFAASNPFSDVAAGHWAEKHITKLALQGIVLGSNGKFRPSDKVTRQEAIIIALKFMGLADQVDDSGVLAFPSSLVIKDDYKKFLKAAFLNKLLIPEEEIALAESEKGKKWGYEPASREWLTRLLVRAIGKQEEAASNTGSTAFADDSSIDDALRGYVKVAVSEGLVSGMTATTFEPKTAVNRAMIARLFSLAEAKTKVAYSGQASGTIIDVSDTSITVLHDDGTINERVLTPDTVFYRFDSDKPITIADLKLFGKASLISDGDGAIGYVEQTDDTPQVKSYDGTLTLKNTTTGKLTLLIGEEYKPFTYDLLHPPVIKDFTGKTISAADLPVNVDVSVQVDTIRAEGKVLTVTVKQAVENKSGSGTVVAWDPAALSLEVKDAVSGVTEKLKVSTQATYVRGDVPVKADNLKVGDAISYDVKLGAVSSVQIAQAAVTSVTGKFVSLNKSEKIITYNDGKGLASKYVIDYPSVKIDGMTDATVEDLQKDDQVTLSLNDADKVTQIAVNDRSVIVTSATVAGYIADTRTLSLIDAAGKTRNLILPSNVRYDMNGTSLTEASALALVGVKGKKIVVAYSGENVVYVSIVAKYNGTVVENNTSSRTLKISLTGTTNQTVTVPYSYPAVEWFGTNAKTYADVKVGDVVSVLLNGNQDQASIIQMQKTVQLEIVSVDAINNKIRTKRADGVLDDWYIATSIGLQDESGNAASLGAFTAGAVANVTFVGNTPVKFKQVSVQYGTIKSVNTAASTVELTLPNGSTVTKSVGASPLITINGATSSTLSSVQANDRVEIRKDESERTVIQVVPALSKVVWTVELSTRTLNVKRANLTENYSFPVPAQAYIHQGATTLTLSDLKPDDTIKLYILRGVVVEVSK
ncbi:S-layer homology domain-containing protein [Cohnella faecalis]|uniref:S-layer homology domain-containing protein n=1 Tax=Cohnella faecalis TaxID=2315694 RepID=A0A398CY42_9BACL|nr:S-layer homology domain-containing protein [Cohnella faecalis]RIE04707.1 S-layer homology domain-containing protein [Cohnella faecalis]